MGDVIDEVANRWKDFTSVEQAQIATAMAGTYQRNVFVATMENYDKVLRYTAESANAAGVAEEKYEDVLDSIDAKINNLISTWDTLVNNLNAGPIFAGIIDAGTGLIEIFDFLINKAHLFQISIGVVALSGIIKLNNAIKSLSKGTNGLSVAFNAFKQAGNNTDLMGKAIQNLTLSQQKLVLSTRQLSKEEQIQALTAAGVSKKVAEEATNTVILSASQKGAITTTAGLSAAVKGLGAAIMANPIGFALTALTIAVTAFSVLADKSKQKAEEIQQKAEEIRNSYNQNTDNINVNIRAVENLTEEYNELAKGVDKYGNNLSLTDSEYKRYSEIVNELIGYAPELQQNYQIENGLISDKNSLIEETIKLLKEQKRLELEEYTAIDNLKDNIQAYADNYVKAQKKVDEAVQSTKDLLDDTVFYLSGEGDIHYSSLIRAYGEYLQDTDQLLESSIDEFSQKYENSLQGFGEFLDIYSEDVARNFGEISQNMGLSPDTEEYIKYSNLIKESVQSLDVAYKNQEKINNSVRETLKSVYGLVDGYEEANRVEKTFLDSYINSIDVSDILGKDNKIDVDKLMTIKNNIKNFADKLLNDPQVQEEVNKLSTLFEFKNMMPAEEWADQMSNQLDKVIDLTNAEMSDSKRTELKLNVGIDQDKIRRLKDELKNKFSGKNFDAQIDLLSEEELVILQRHLDDLSGDESWDEIEQSIRDWKVAVDEASISFEEYDTLVKDAASSVKEVEDVYKSLNSAVEEYNTNGSISLNTLDELIGLGAEYLQYLEFENGQLKLNKEGMIELANSRLDNVEALLLEQKNTLLQTKLDGIKAIASKEAATVETTLANSLIATALATTPYASGLEAATIATEKLIAEINGLDSNAVESYENSPEGKRIAGLLAGVDAGLDAVASLRGNIGASFDSVVASSSSSAKSTTDPWKEEFEKLYKDLQYQRDMDEIDAMTYYQQLDQLNQKYFADNERYLDEYRQYNKEVYQGITSATKEEFQEMYKDLQYQRDMDLIDAQSYYQQLMSLTQKYFANNKRFLDEYRKYSKEIYQGLKKEAEDAEKEKAQAEIDAIDDKIKALQKQKQELQDTYKEQDRLFELQKAKDRYEAAKNQLVNRVYRNDQGWVKHCPR